MKISITNLASDAVEDDLRTLFELFGKVSSVEIRKERGMGIVDMPSRGAAKEAMSGLEGQTLLGHEIEVKEAMGKGGSNRGKATRRRRRR
jgi:RNA recognition motif-containing protein